MEADQVSQVALVINGERGHYKRAVTYADERDRMPSPAAPVSESFDNPGQRFRRADR
jgi:hypothetical protein